MGSGGGGDSDAARQTQPLLGKLPAEPSYSSSDSEEHAVKRTGTVWTAMAHIITAVIGSGVLSLAWSVAQLGWVGGPVAMVFFAGVTAVQSSLIADCYITHDPERGVVRNRSYVDAVRLYLGEKSQLFCGFFLNFSLFGTGVVYTLTSATSMRAIQKANCYHREGHDAPCSAGGDGYYMLMFGLAQVVLSQIPNFHDMAGLSVFAAAMSFFYALVGVGLGVAKVIGTYTPYVVHQPHGSFFQQLVRWFVIPSGGFSKRGDQGRHRRHSHGVHDAEGVASLAGPRGHRLRLPLLLGAAGNRGHPEVAAAGDRDDEEGDEGEHPDHHLLLPLLRVLRLRGVRRRHPGQPPNRLRLLRALLAHRPRQPLHRPPPPRRLPGVHAAGVRVRGPAVQRRRRRGRRNRRAPRERVPAVLPHGVRGGDDGAGRVVPVLQPGDRAAGRLHLLAARHPLPRGDVPRQEQGGAVDQAVARHPGVQRRLPTHLRVRLRRLGRGGVRLQDELNSLCKRICRVFFSLGTAVTCSVHILCL